MAVCLQEEDQTKAAPPFPPELEDRAGPVQAASAPTSPKLELGCNLRPCRWSVTCRHICVMGRITHYID